MVNARWKMTDSLMRDYKIDENLLIETLDVSVMGNPFYAEVSALYEQLQMDGLIQGGGQVIENALGVTENARILANSFRINLEIYSFLRLIA